MPARIHHICQSGHDDEDRGRAGPAITLVEKQWAYCPRGGYQNHDWKRLDQADGIPLADLTAKILAGKPLIEPLTPRDRTRAPTSSGRASAAQQGSSPGSD